MSFILLGILNSQVVSGPSGPLAGYVAGGGTPTRLSTVQKFSFPTDTRSQLSTGLSGARSNIGAGFASTTSGYVAGGQIDGPTRLTTVDKFNLLDDTRTTLATGLSQGADLTTGMASSTAGYVGGCRGGLENTVNKFAFADDSRTILSNFLGVDTQGMAAFASATNGYFVGGFDGARTNKVDRMNFSDDTRTRLGATLSVAKFNAGSTSNPSWPIAYVAGGSTNAAGHTTTVEKFFFSTETFTTLGTGLSEAVTDPAGFASLTHGYFAGGVTSANRTSTVNKFDISNDARTTTTSMPAATDGASGFAGQ